MPVTPWLVGLIAASAFVQGSVGQAEPSENALTAIATLSASSTALPLPGSAELDDGLYSFDGDCEQAVALYLAPDAPVPSGALVEQRGQSIVVTLPFATTGVFFESSTGACQYQILNAPTARVASTLEAVPTADSYGPVLCSEASESTELIVMTELVVAGQLATLAIKEEGAALIGGSIADIFAAGYEPPLPLAVTVVSPGPEQFEFEITGQSGTARVTGDCTGSVYQFLSS
jgi:hypothetical protein